MAQDIDGKNLITRTAEIVSAYVSKNPIPTSGLPALIGSVHQSLTGLTDGPRESAQQLTPAVPVKKSVHRDYIICLEDGKKFKSLKRHLNVRYGLTPDEYRKKWDLPASYPMVAPAYAAARSALAKEMGLGRKPKAAPVVTPAKRGRRKASAGA
jgi:predicted transcriptional regulator